MAEWVDFAELKDRVSLEDILQHYGLLEGLKPLKGGEELVGLCPFHSERRGSFHASTTKNAWNCFGCHRHGNILDLVAQKEDVSIREAALLIADWFGAGHGDSGKPVKSAGQGVHEVGVNKPLTFELKSLQGDYPYLKERGLTAEAIEHFGLGYCSRGLMKGRVVIPLHDEAGQLIGYAGRWPGEPPKEVERYILPGGFFKSAVVYNLNRVRETAKLRAEGSSSRRNLWRVSGVPATWTSTEPSAQFLTHPVSLSDSAAWRAK